VVSIGRIPAAGVLGFTPPDRGWSGRSVVAGNSHDDLSGAQRECEAVANKLGVAPLLREECTFEAVRDALTATPEKRLDVLHLAVHGRADARRGGRSSLLFAGDRPTWVPFAELAALPWNANLIVFSGCSTAVGGSRNGLGLYGVAQAAAEAGATTVIASLWPVDDISAENFMKAFYAELSRRRGSGLIDLRELMDHARTQLRQTAQIDPHTVRRDARELIITNRGPIRLSKTHTKPR
jgi:CHAT domain-containing protein